jgi:hypothetical protein
VDERRGNGTIGESNECGLSFFARREKAENQVQKEIAKGI